MVPADPVHILIHGTPRELIALAARCDQTDAEGQQLALNLLHLAVLRDVKILSMHPLASPSQEQ